MNLPAGTAGNIVALQDYKNTFASNNLTVTPNGTNKINGSEGTITLETNGEGLTLVYVDSTVGWRSVTQSEFTDAGFSVLSATGGTVLTVGDYKTHVFTGPGTFCVASGNDTVDYFVVAGGGGTGGVACQTGGGGAGGFRVSNRCGSGISGPLTSPLANPTGIPITSGPYAVTVGAGGANVSPPSVANPGSNSIFSSITSAGGGSGRGPVTAQGNPGGSGGGSQNGAGASGNTPPVSPPQGNSGGSGNRSGPQYGAGGGGGAGGTGTNGSSSSAGPGGAGSYIADSFIGPTAPSYGTPGPVGSARYFAGGGGGSGESTAGNGGAGGGGDGNTNTSPSANAGSTNTGGGAGSGNDASGSGASGGSGIVMIRYKFQ